MEEKKFLRPRRKRVGEQTQGTNNDGREHRSGFHRGERPRFGEKKSFGPGKSSGPRRGFRPGEAKSEHSGISRMINERKKKFGAPELSDNEPVRIPVKEVIRLNKFIANSGVCSRREADTLIQAGVVTVNGEVVTELGSKINIYKDEVRFNGEKLKGEAKVYVILNKPRGYVTTTTDPHAEKTVMELLRGCNARVFPVGRLDKNTTGVLMFTNDGEMAEKLTHPSFEKKKIYQVNLDRALKQEDFDQIMTGVELNDGMIAADDLQYIDATDRRKIGIEIHSGKNRIVRRIFESFGYEVKGLDRVYFAGLTKKGLKRGEWRFLTEGEVNILRMGAFK
ncbi:MAG: rRNA pseudouridine synthase [Bacteroidales bacterium]|nr:rRNA pseudouridine synthase [Bacteroidales bacterium]